MSAERLREAARVLRERAEVADVHPKNQLPWMVDPDSPRTVLAPKDVDGYDGLLIARQVEPPNASYVVTMHPGVGLALADWLDDYASWVEVFRDTARTRENTPALRVADQILGSES